MPVSVPAPALPADRPPVSQIAPFTAAGDAAAAYGYRDLDLTAAIAALRALALASVAAAVRGRGGGALAPSPAAAALPGGRIDAAAMAALWPLVVAPALAGGRRRRAAAVLQAPLPRHHPDAGAGAVPELAVAAAAAATPPRLYERLTLAVTPPGGVVAGAAILDVVAAAALQQPALVATVDALVRERLRPAVVLPRAMAPVRLSDRSLLTLIAMVLVPRPVVAAPTRRQRFGRAFRRHVAALWAPGEIPGGWEAWLFTEALRSRPRRIDPALAALADSAGLSRWPRFAGATDTTTTDTAGADTLPEPLARFLRCRP